MSPIKSPRITVFTILIGVSVTRIVRVGWYRLVGEKIVVFSFESSFLISLQRTSTAEERGGLFLPLLR